MYTLKKVKNVDNTYKVYNEKERPVLKVKKTVFVETNVMKLDGETIKSIIDIESEIKSVIKDGYTIIGSIKTVLEKDRPISVLNVDSRGHEYTVQDKSYTIMLVCRSIKYIDNLAIVNWMIESMEEIVVDDDVSEDDEDDNTESEIEMESDEEEEEEDIEAPVDYLLILKSECMEKVSFLSEKLEQIKDDIEHQPLKMIPKIADDLKSFYNEELEK